MASPSLKILKNCDEHDFKGALKGQKKWPNAVMKVCRLIHTEHCDNDDCSMCHPSLEGGSSSVDLCDLTKLAIRIYDNSCDIAKDSAAVSVKVSTKALVSLFDAKDTPSFDQSMVRLCPLSSLTMYYRCCFA